MQVVIKLAHTPPEEDLHLSHFLDCIKESLPLVSGVAR
jgi:hypothetical protein